ncbi:probable trehalase [Tanacetum coccineum]
MSTQATHTQSGLFLNELNGVPNISLILQLCWRSGTFRLCDGPKTENGSVLVFVKFMNETEDDLEHVVHVDYVVEPHGFLPKVVHKGVRDWGLEVHSLWKNLSRKVSKCVLKHPELHTLLPLKYPVIIHRSRFQEIYYWDSYWVIRGLLASKMYETEKGIVLNLIDLIDIYEYVLNAARAYYTNRSQPPLLSSMVVEVYTRTNDMDLVKKALPALIKHKFWNSGIHNVAIEDDQGLTHNLSRKKVAVVMNKASAKGQCKAEDIEDPNELFHDDTIPHPPGKQMPTKSQKSDSSKSARSSSTVLDYESLRKCIFKIQSFLQVLIDALNVSLSFEYVHVASMDLERRFASSKLFLNQDSLSNDDIK